MIGSLPKIILLDFAKKNWELDESDLLAGKRADDFKEQTTGSIQGRFSLWQGMSDQEQNLRKAFFLCSISKVPSLYGSIMKRSTRTKGYKLIVQPNYLNTLEVYQAKAEKLEEIFQAQLVKFAKKDKNNPFMPFIIQTILQPALEMLKKISLEKVLEYLRYHSSLEKFGDSAHFYELKNILIQYYHLALMCSRNTEVIAPSHEHEERLAGELKMVPFERKELSAEELKLNALKEKSLNELLKTQLQNFIDLAKYITKMGLGLSGNAGECVEIVKSAIKRLESSSTVSVICYLEDCTYQLTGQEIFESLRSRVAEFKSRLSIEQDGQKKSLLSLLRKFIQRTPDSTCAFMIVNKAIDEIEYKPVENIINDLKNPNPTEVDRSFEDLWSVLKEFEQGFILKRFISC